MDANAGRKARPARVDLSPGRAGCTSFAKVQDESGIAVRFMSFLPQRLMDVAITHKPTNGERFHQFVNYFSGLVAFTIINRYRLCTGLHAG